MSSFCPLPPGAASTLDRRLFTADGESRMPSAWREALLELPLCVPQSAWVGHIPFMFLVFKLTRPRVFVELGVDLGSSFLAACEAAHLFHTDTRCFGVDTWRGDEHTNAKYYCDGDAVFEALHAFVAARYPACLLLRQTFDDASARFEDNSIDVLHIDGLHTYEAVARDFATWLPKLSDRSIALFHDTEVRFGNFGVYKFWSEIKASYRHLQFRHSCGLGMLVTGTAAPPELTALVEFAASDQSGLLEALCQAAADDTPRRMTERGPPKIKEITLLDELVLRKENGHEELRTTRGERRRNELCHCGSGLRYKHCHGKFV
jgi:hypothetical protein